jgi:hypothetical protein
MDISEVLRGRTIVRVVARGTQDFEEGLFEEDRRPATQMEGLELCLDDGSSLVLSGAHFYDEGPSLIAEIINPMS